MPDGSLITRFVGLFELSRRHVTSLEPIQDSGNDQSNIDLDKARQEAFAEGEAKGLAEGRRLAQEELADKQQQFEIDARDELHSFMASINEDLIDHNRLAAPLKRLAECLQFLETGAFSHCSRFLPVLA